MSLTKWYIVANIKLSDKAYLSYMANDINSFDVLNENFISNGNRIDNEVTTTQNLKKTYSPINFFANELIESKLNLKHNLLHLSYNKQSASLEFVSRVEATSDMAPVYLKLATILSTVKFIDCNAESVCILSSTNIDNIKAYFLLSKASIISMPKDLIPKNVPSDIALLYHNATSEISTNIFASKSTDPDILNKFYRLVDDKLAIGTDNIINQASMESLEILTSDALYFTDGINVLTRYGEIVPRANPHTFASLGGYYSKDDNNIFYGTDIIRDADLKSFIRIGTDYAKDKQFAYYQGKPFTKISTEFKVHRPAEGYAIDKKTVYHNGKAIAGSDGATFHAIGEPLALDGAYFGADVKQVYLDGKIIDYIDPKTFKHISKQFFKDAKNVYTFSTIIPNCSPKNVKVLNKFYIVDNDKTTFFILGRNSLPIENIDVKSIKVNGYFLTDKNDVYFKGKKLHSLIGSETDISNEFNDGYIFDKKSVYYFDKPLLADRKTFATLGFGYAKDATNIYFRNAQLEGVDMSTFSPISYGYAADKNSVYNCENKLFQTTYEDRVRIAGNYSKNHYDIYYKTRKILGADYDTFDVIDDERYPQLIDGYNIINLLSSDKEQHNKFITNFAFDKHNIFFKDKIIKDVDLQTFKVFDKAQINKTLPRPRNIRLYSKDKNRIYFKNEPIKQADIKTFKPFSIENVWIDDQYIYLDGEVITYIDLTTYKNIAYNFYQDKKSVYYEIDIIDNLSLTGLTVLHKNYIKDDKNICYVNRIDSRYLVKNIFTADFESLNILATNDEFAFDKHQLFFLGKLVQNIKIKDVEFLNGRYFKTDDNIYYGSKRIPVRDVKNITLLPDDYMTDEYSSYFRYSALDTSKAVKVLGYGYATDGTKYWKNGAEVDDIDNDIYLRNIFLNG